MSPQGIFQETIPVSSGSDRLRPRTRPQRKYIEAISSTTLFSASGPAGTGKTYLAMAMADRRSSGAGEQIILVRPAVEAGEKLGFLPVTSPKRSIPTSGRSMTRSMI